MSTGRHEDRENTIRILHDAKAPQVGKTWLNHRVYSQSGMIDMMLLEGKYTVEEMAQKLQAIFTDRSYDTLCQRVRDHIDHLQEGDARDMSTIHANDDHRPHHLKLRQIQGRWSFDPDQ